MPPNAFDPLVEFIDGRGFRQSAPIIRSHLETGSFEAFELFSSPERDIDVPLFCLIRNIGVVGNEMDLMDVTQLKEEITVLQNRKKLSLYAVGLLLDKILLHQKKHKVLTSIQDITRLVVLLESPSPMNLVKEISNETLSRLTTSSFWKSMMILWLSNYGIKDESWIFKKDVLPDDVVALFCAGNLTTIKHSLEQNDNKGFMDLVQNLNVLQSSNYPISKKQWKNITDRRASVEEIKPIHLLAEAARISVLNWLKTKDDEEGNPTTEQQIARTIHSLFLEFGWRTGDLGRIFQFDRSAKEELLTALNICLEYSTPNMPVTSNQLQSLPKTITTASLKGLMKVLTEQLFQPEHKYSCEQAIHTILEMSEFNEMAKISGPDFYSTYKKYLVKYQGVEQQCRTIQGLAEKIKATRISKLNQTKGHVMNVRVFKNNLERVAAAVFAVNTFFNIQLRDVQVLALILARFSRRVSLPRIFQMQTGEGKTYVVAALAVYEVLNGNLVDVVTSSSELAVNQCDELFGFYRSLGLTVAHNANNKASDEHSGVQAVDNLLAFSQMIMDGIPNANLDQNKLKVYQADVVYGAAADFMGDVLREEFEGSQLRHRRGFQVAIVDEVDNMLLDGRNDSVRLASSSPGMVHLLGIKASVWQLINIIHSQMIKENGRWYYKDNTENGEEITEFNSDLELYDFVNERSLEFIKKALRLSPLTRQEDSGDPDWDLKLKESNEGRPINMAFPELEYPIWLKSFIEAQLPKWVESAVKARFFMEPNFDYIIQNNKLVVVDAANTGVHHPTMQWGHGLHQFLQMKHALEVQPESLPTNFLSNVAFFLRYKTNILGLTGTIGGDSSRKFLQDVYGVDFVDVPPFMQRRHVELRPQICQEREWLTTVVKTAVEKMELGRAVLLITQYIQHAEEIQKSIAENIKGKGMQVQLYTSKDTNHVLNKTIQPGTCIVATNIAGRGADLKVSKEVLESGGLHVLLTVLPETDRVERQNIGRTSRTGQVGTSQIILNTDHLGPHMLNALLDSLNQNSTQQAMLSSLRQARDRRSMKSVEKALEDRKKTEKADETLLEYISFRSRLLGFTHGEDIERKCLDARFGRHLAVTEVINKEDMLKEFNGTTDCIDAPTMAVLYAQKHFDGKPGSEEYQKAFDYLSKAIRLDDKFCPSAYYFRAALRLDWYMSKGGIGHIRDAIADFKKSKECLERMKLQYEILIQATVIHKKQGEQPKNEEKTEEAKTLVAYQCEKNIIVCETIIKNIEGMVGRDITDDLKYYERAIAEAKENNNQNECKKLEDQYKDLISNETSISRGVLGDIEKNRHEIKIKQQLLKDALPGSETKSSYTTILQQFQQEGFGYVLLVTDRPPINWWVVVAVAGAALLQIVGGMAAIAFSIGAGAKLGLALIQEGIGDAIYAIKNGIINRNINWASYGMRKAISLAITFVTLGWGTIKSAGSGIAKGARAGISIIKGGATKVAVDGWKAAVKKVAQTAVNEVSKEMLWQTFDYVAGETANAAVSKLVTEACYKVVNPLHGQNPDLKKLVEWDNRQGKRTLTNAFVKQTLAPLTQNESFLKDVGSVVGKLAGRGLENAGVNGAAGCFDNAIKVAGALSLATSLKQYLFHIPKVLRDLVYKNEKKYSQDEVQHENRGYVNQQLTPENVLYTLSQKLANFYSPLIISTASTALIGQFVEKNMRNLFNADVDLGHHRMAFVDSEVVAQQAKQMKQAAGEGEDSILIRNRNATIEHIIGVAKDEPGDIIQAEELSNATKQRIEIELPNGDVKVFGDEHSGAPVKLKFKPGENGEIGHYSLSDGQPVTSSGNNSCLFDAVGAATGYDPKLLRKATANFMLHNLDETTFRYATIDENSLLVGGEESQKRDKSPARKVRHSLKVKKWKDLKQSKEESLAERQARADRKAKCSKRKIVDSMINTTQDMDSSEFDDFARIRCEESGLTSGDLNVTYDETMIYHTHVTKGEITEVVAHRGKMTVVAREGKPVHYREVKESSPLVTLWKAGDDPIPDDADPKALYEAKRPKLN